MRNYIVLSLCLLSLFYSCFTSAAKQAYVEESPPTVKIYGFVTDYGNDPIDNVTVTWKDETFREKIAEAVTGTDGYYEALIPVDRYYCISPIAIWSSIFNTIVWKCME